MSDILTLYEQMKFTQEVNISNAHSPVLKRDFLALDKIAVTLEVRYSFLRELFKAKSSFPDLTFISILNSQIKFLQLVQCDRLENRLYHVATDVSRLYSRTNGGRQKNKLGMQVKKIAVFHMEVENVVELSGVLAKFETENVELTKQCHELLNDLKLANDLRKTSERDLHDTKENLAKVVSDNESMLESGMGVSDEQNYQNQGKSIDQLSRSQRCRKITALKNNVSKALWFSESYGLQPSAVMFHDSQGGSVNVELSKTDSNDDIEKMKEIIFILDKFKISDKAYHEIVTKTEDLPKLHSIINIRDKMNNELLLHRTPGNTPGAYVSLKSELEKFVCRQKIQPGKLKIKISGDGTKVSRISNYVVISFSVLDNSKLSSDEQIVLAIVKAPEKYETLDKCLFPVFQEINELSSAGKIQIEENVYDVDIFFGGDMKFLQICLGLGSSTGEFACPWCKVSKHDRGDTTKPWDYYHSDCLKRTIREITEFSTLSKNQFGVKFKPLISIEPECIIPDELHLLMRVFDVLLRNLIDDCIDQDNEKQVVTGKNVKEHLNGLVEKIRQCGVSFTIWTSKGGDMDWTSLTGNDVKKVLRNLPDKLFFIIHNDTHDNVVSVWKNFSELYSFICSDIVETKPMDFIFAKCKQWVDDFLALGETGRKGYGKHNITPYMHCLVYHVPFFLHKYGSLRKFSGQPTEKINDDIKSIHHMKTNRYDCAMDALKVRKRIESNSDFSRDKRSYQKKNDVYWDDVIKNTRAHKKETILQEIKDADSKFVNERDTNVLENLENLTVSDIKQKLKELGVTTKIRKHEKLLQLLKDSI